jgi:hypothetical protein
MDLRNIRYNTGRTCSCRQLTCCVLCVCCAVSCRCYLVQRQRAEQLGRSAPGFTKWVEDRRELSHLLNHANLNT